MENLGRSHPSYKTGCDLFFQRLKEEWHFFQLYAQAAPGFPWPET